MLSLKWKDKKIYNRVFYSKKLKKHSKTWWNKSWIWSYTNNHQNLTNLKNKNHRQAKMDEQSIK